MKQLLANIEHRVMWENEIILREEANEVNPRLSLDFSLEAFLDQRTGKESNQNSVVLLSWEEKIEELREAEVVVFAGEMAKK